jgi:hypothetical protein
MAKRCSPAFPALGYWRTNRSGLVAAVRFRRRSARKRRSRAAWLGRSDVGSAQQKAVQLPEAERCFIALRGHTALFVSAMNPVGALAKTHMEGRLEACWISLDWSKRIHK